MTDLACGLCNDLSIYPGGVTLRGCPVHHPTFWRVETISALYFLDFTHGVVVRERKTNPMHPDWPEPSHLRRDGESMELISVDLCQEGVQPAQRPSIAISWDRHAGHNITRECRSCPNSTGQRRDGQSTG